MITDFVERLLTEIDRANPERLDPATVKSAADSAMRVWLDEMEETRQRLRQLYHGA